ncbi:MAG: 30S ribosomal protein S18, partial [Candidatus Acidiferrales bacterium]
PRPPAPPAAPSGPSGHSGPPSGGHSGPPSGGHSGPPGRFGPGGPRPQGGPGGPGGRPGGPAKRGKRSFVRKKKVCRFCVDKSDYIDYKKAEILAPFLQERGKILPRRMTGTCSRHQRWLTVAIKRAQNIALLPFAAEL